jgi:hypothetical protein
MGAGVPFDVGSPPESKSVVVMSVMVLLKFHKGKGMSSDLWVCRSWSSKPGSSSPRGIADCIDDVVKSLSKPQCPRLKRRGRRLSMCRQRFLRSRARRDFGQASQRRTEERRKWRSEVCVDHRCRPSKSFFQKTAQKSDNRQISPSLATPIRRPRSQSFAQNPFLCPAPK